MQLTDTHIHLYSEDFDPDREVLIKEAMDAGVKRFVLPNIDHDSINPMFDLCNKYKDICFPMVGLHPCYVVSNFNEQLAEIHKVLLDHKDVVVAVGEIGLDFYWDVTLKKEQEEAFRIQTAWAAEMNLPISIHSRNSTAEIITILRDLNHKDMKGVFHCFSGNINQADEIMNMGFYLGIGGVVTFKNSTLEGIVADVPMEFIILETDGPYLAPTPYRGKRNKPAYLKIIAEKVAEIKNVTIEELASATSANADKLFNLKC